MNTRRLPIVLLALAAACGDGAQDPAAPPAEPAGGGVAGVEWADWETTPSGLQYFVVEEGRGERRARTGDQVTVHYTGTFPETGKIFDSSRRSGQPFTFMLGVGQVIAGWDEGVALMREGSRVKLRVPWQLAYGEAGRGQIPSRQDLLFDVELLRIKPGVEVADFPRRNPAAETTLESGLAYEVLEPGDASKGPAVGEGVGLKIHYTLWNEAGQFVMNSGTRGGGRGNLFITGEVGKLQVGASPEPFLQEAARLMKPGGVYRLTVPAELCWGDNVVHPRIEKGAPTVWRLELVDTMAIPPFVMPDLEKAVATESGLQYEVLKEGSGPSPGPTDQVRVHYAGWLTDGTRFDSSYERTEPIVFPANRVIRGWQELLQLMKPGMVVRALIPAELAYGAQPPRGSGIPANAALVFQVELLEVVR